MALGRHWRLTECAVNSGLPSDAARLRADGSWRAEQTRKIRRSPRNTLVAEDCSRRLHAARQRRLDRTHVFPTVKGFAGEEHRSTMGV
jgi:hypothetical protein